MYWFPNRPLLQTRDFLGRMDRGEVAGEWWAEPKLNGDRLVLFREGGRWRFFNRHKSELKYRPPAEMLSALESLRDWKGECQLDGELLHNHTKGVKNLVVLYDAYVVDGQRCRGPLSERRCWLEGLHGGTSPSYGEKILPWSTLGNGPVVLSARYADKFKTHFDLLTAREEVEGLVFKLADGLLDFNGIKSPDVVWQVKVRRPAKNYKF